MTPVETLILVLYFFVLSILAIYGWHRYYLVYLYMKHRDNVPKQPASPLDPLPRVTVQLPIFNEMYVADRLIQAVCQLDYPRHLLEIQVLDDSSDETRDIAAQSVERQAERGFQQLGHIGQACARSDRRYFYRTFRSKPVVDGSDSALTIEVTRGIIRTWNADPADFAAVKLRRFVAHNML